jgi:hypothetical protein
MKVILENTETGELKQLHDKGNFRTPWRIKEVIPETDKQTHELQATLAVYAAKLNLPIGQFLDAARWLLNKKCPFCQLGTQVLKRVKELGEERSIDLIRRILTAKDSNDLETLNHIKQELNG